MGVGDLNDTTDPTGRDRRVWIEQSMKKIVANENELAAWRGQLSMAQALGVIRCDRVLAYNKAALKNYYTAADFYIVIDKLVIEMRAQGYTILPGEVPYPILFGTSFSVGGQPNARTFGYGLTCTPSGGFATSTPAATLRLGPCGGAGSPGGGGGEITPSVQRALMPAGTPEVTTTKAGTLVHMNPYETIESLSNGFAGPGAVAAACGASYLAAGVCLGLALIGWGILSTFSSKTLPEITGSAKDRINKGLYEDQLAQERKREEFYNKCMQQRLGVLPPGTITADQMKAWGDECLATAIKNYPDKTPPYASSLLAGITTVLLVGGGAAALILIARNRGRHAED